jgi:hypothetical protein
MLGVPVVPSETGRLSDWLVEAVLRVLLWRRW